MSLTLAERGRLGGIARAEKMPPEERVSAAQKAAAARWPAVKAQCAGRLHIGDLTFDVAVTEHGQRVILQSDMLKAFGRSGRPKSQPGGGIVLFGTNLDRFMSPDLQDALAGPIPLLYNKGRHRNSYPAEVLPDLCAMYLDARAHPGVLTAHQLPQVRAAETVAVALSKVGIIALVDEATGYQDIRDRDELQLILQRYITAELMPYVRRFPDGFFQEMFRLYGWTYTDQAHKPGYVGTLINRLVYDQMPPGVADQLKNRTAVRKPSGGRRHIMHRYLTPDTGVDCLKNQLSNVTMLMRMSRTKEEFWELFERAYPSSEAQEELEFGAPLAGVSGG